MCLINSFLLWRIVREMRAQIFLLGLAGFLLVTSNATADVVLNVESYQLNNGYSIDGGTITVTDEADDDGMLNDSSEIIGWNIRVTFGNAGSHVFSSDLAGHLAS